MAAVGSAGGARRGTSSFYQIYLQSRAQDDATGKRDRRLLCQYYFLHLARNTVPPDWWKHSQFVTTKKDAKVSWYISSTQTIKNVKKKSEKEHPKPTTPWVCKELHKKDWEEFVSKKNKDPINTFLEKMQVKSWIGHTTFSDKFENETFRFFYLVDADSEASPQEKQDETPAKPSTPQKETKPATRSQTAKQLESQPRHPLEDAVAICTFSVEPDEFIYNSRLIEQRVFVLADIGRVKGKDTKGTGKILFYKSLEKIKEKNPSINVILTHPFPKKVGGVTKEGRIAWFEKLGFQKIKNAVDGRTTAQKDDRRELLVRDVSAAGRPNRQEGPESQKKVMVVRDNTVTDNMQSLVDEIKRAVDNKGISAEPVVTQAAGEGEEESTPVDPPATKAEEEILPVPQDFKQSMQKEGPNFIDHLNKILTQPCFSGLPSKSTAHVQVHCDTKFLDYNDSMELILGKCKNKEHESMTMLSKQRLKFYRFGEKIIVEFNSLTPSKYQKQKFNLFLRCVVILMVSDVIKKWKTKDSFKIYTGSNVVSAISAHVLQKYFDIKPVVGLKKIGLRRAFLKDCDCKQALKTLQILPKGNETEGSPFSRLEILEKWINEKDVQGRYDKVRALVPCNLEGVTIEYNLKLGFSHMNLIDKPLLKKTGEVLLVVLNESNWSQCKECVPYAPLDGEPVNPTTEAVIRDLVGQ